MKFQTRLAALLKVAVSVLGVVAFTKVSNADQDFLEANGVKILPPNSLTASSQPSKPTMDLQNSDQEFLEANGVNILPANTIASNSQPSKPCTYTGS